MTEGYTIYLYCFLLYEREMTPPLTLLHVDDDPDFLDVSSSLFADGETFETLTAPSAEDGLRLLEAHEVDCIVSDFVVSADGTPFISAARDVAEDIPIVLFTGKEWETVSEQAIAADVTEYVQKSGVDEIQAVKQRVRQLVTGELTSVGVADENQLDLLPTVSPVTSLAVSAAALDEEWRLIGSHDWTSSEELGVTVLEAIEAFTGEDADMFASLFESIDADALQSVLAPRTDGSERPGIQVRFPYRGYELAVTSDGEVAIRRLP